MVTTQGRRIVDSTVIDQGGDFRFRVKLPEKGPVFYNLLCDGSAIPLIVTPGDRIEVNSLCDLARNYTVEGSEESQLLKQFNTQYGNGVATLDSLSKIYRNTPVVADTEKRRKNLLDQYLAEYYRIKREHIAFIMAHPSSMAAVYALYQRLPDDPWLFNEKTDLIYYRIVADSSSVRYPDASRVKVLQQRDRRAEKGARTGRPDTEPVGERAELSGNRLAGCVRQGSEVVFAGRKNNPRQFLVDPGFPLSGAKRRNEGAV